MSSRTAGPEILRLIELMSKLPGMGPRSARRAALALLKQPDTMLMPLAQAMSDAAQKITACSNCGNFDTTDPCSICAMQGRTNGLICVVEDVSDLWALERSGEFRGLYHVLGGRLSALDGVGPEDLNIDRLIDRVEGGDVEEIILAMNATVDGQITAHYVSDRLDKTGVRITRLAHGVPVGSDLGALDDGTLAAALSSRRQA